MRRGAEVGAVAVVHGHDVDVRDLDAGGERRLDDGEAEAVEAVGVDRQREGDAGCPSAPAPSGSAVARMALMVALLVVEPCSMSKSRSVMPVASTKPEMALASDGGVGAGALEVGAVGAAEAGLDVAAGGDVGLDVGEVVLDVGRDVAAAAGEHEGDGDRLRAALLLHLHERREGVGAGAPAPRVEVGRELGDAPGRAFRRSLPPPPFRFAGSRRGRRPRRRRRGRRSTAACTCAASAVAVAATVAVAAAVAGGRPAWSSDRRSRPRAPASTPGAVRCEPRSSCAPSFARTTPPARPREAATGAAGARAASGAGAPGVNLKVTKLP